MQPSILPPRTEELLAPLLASLPAASISPQPPTALLPLLSPILRQRVQLLSSTSSATEPWLPLLTYDTSISKNLSQIVKNERFEPHPVSGEVEIDYATETSTSYRRIDSETLQALIALSELELGVKLTYCTNDSEGGGDGWRISELTILPKNENAQEPEWGYASIGAAEAAFTTQPPLHHLSTYNRTNGTNALLTPEAEEDDDDAYWAQYDNTPARTPAPKASPAPGARMNGLAPLSAVQGDEDGDESEKAYYAQYATVQPAMDDHDPDEAGGNGEVESTLGRDEITQELRQQQQQREFSHPNIDQEHELQTSSLAWSGVNSGAMEGMEVEGLAHPRPGSSTGSSGSSTVEKLEKQLAAREAREQSEVGIKQHIGSSIKSLYRLAKVAGIERGEFERLVRTELECLAIMDEGDE